MIAAGSIIDFISDPELLGRWFSGPSWDRWRAVLRAAFALPMTRRDRALFAEVAGGRKPPTRPVRELVIAAGRGAGKDSIASALAAYVAVTGDFTRLRPGERGTILTLANDREQAGIAFGFTRGYFVDVPLLAGLVERETADTLDLTTGATIAVTTANPRAPRGRTVAAAVYDEVGFWRSEESASPDVDIDAAVAPGLMRFPGSLKIIISSVNKRSGLLYERITEFHGKDSDDVLAILGTSRQFNPTLNAAEIDRAVERDPERAGAEYLSQWRSDVGIFLDRELVESAVDRGVAVRRTEAEGYVAGVDTSGGRGDSFTLAVAHADGSVVILDALREWRPPFDPGVVVAEVAAVLREYGIAEVCGDRYAASWPVEAFAKRGVRYITAEHDKSQVYLDLLPLLASGRVRLLDHPRLIYQLVSLERRAGRGRDRVDHPAGAADDLANAAALALVQAAAEGAPSLIRRSDFGAAEEPEARLVAGVVAVLALGLDGRAGVAYFAVPPDHLSAEPIWLLDFEAPAFGLRLFVDIAERLDGLAEGFREARNKKAPIHVGMFVPEPYLGQASDAIWSVFSKYNEPEGLRNKKAVAIEEHVDRFVLSDPARLHFTSAVHFQSGQVRVSATAMERMARLPIALTAALGDFRDAVTTAVHLGVILALEGNPVPAPPVWTGARLVAA